MLYEVITVLVDLDHPQTLCRVAIEQGPDQRRLAGPPGSPEQHVVGRVAGDKLAGVVLDGFLLFVDAEQIVEVDGIDAGNRLQVAGEGVSYNFV